MNHIEVYKNGELVGTAYSAVFTPVLEKVGNNYLVTSHILELETFSGTELTSDALDIAIKQVRDLLYSAKPWYIGRSEILERLEGLQAELEKARGEYL